MAPPGILYKYQSLDNGARERTLRVITEREIWFSSVREFNDPFEARVVISMDGDDDAWLAALGVAKPDGIKLPGWMRKLEEGVRKDAESIGMFCTSSRCDDILMWSHYASKHRGVCLGFRTTGNSILWDAQPVEYSQDYPCFNYLGTTHEERGRKILLTKARQWAYEQEWRVFRVGGPGLEHYPSGMLACVVLGCEIQRTDRDEIIAMVSYVAQPILVYQADRSASVFSLELIAVHGCQSAV